MEENTLKELFLQTRKQYIKLLEFFDLTQQLGEAVDRKDEVSVQMLLHMREDPVHSLQEIEAQLHSGVLKLPELEAIRAHELLTGAAPKSQEEGPLCEQVAQNRRLLDRAQELDRRISMRMDGRHSFYNTFRTEK